MSANPNPARIHDSMWWLWLEIHKLDDDIALGGIYANKRGYHNTRAANDANWPGNYSVIHADDRKGPNDKAAAIDLTFRSAQGGDYKNIEKYSDRLYAAGKANDPRLHGWREFFGQCDADTHVEGWDFRKDQDTTSDSSHLWHIHASEVRAYVESMVNKQCFLSVIKGETLDEYIKAGGKLLTDGTPPLANPPSKQYSLGDRVLRKGMTGTDVRQAQDRLNLHGAKLAEDGDFGAKTEDAVKAFQKAKKLAVDGVIGPQTTAALKTSPHPPAARLVVDGKLGPATIKRWQEVMGTPADGKISDPSELVAAVQRHLNRKINARLKVDGRGIAQDGKRYATVLALQAYLRTSRDGVMSKPVSEVVKAIQARLNKGWF